MKLTGLKDEQGRKVELVISDEGHPHHHVLKVEIPSEPIEIKPIPKTKEELNKLLLSYCLKSRENLWNPEGDEGWTSDFLKEYED